MPADKAKPSPLEKIKATYFTECAERLETIEKRLAELSENPDGDAAEAIDEVFRAVHSIKGGAGAFNFDAVVTLAHGFEAAMDELRSGRKTLSPAILDELVSASDVLAGVIEATRDGGDVAKADIATTVAAFERMIAGDNTTPPAKKPPSQATPTAPKDGQPQTYRIGFEPKPDLFRTANEPLLLLRQLGAMGELSVEVETKRLPSLAELNPEDAYLSWTLELTTEQDQDAVAEVFEFVEDDCILSIEAIGETGRAETAPDDEPAAPAAVPPTALSPAPAMTPKLAEEAPTTTPQKTTTIRVDLDRVDKLVNMVGELVITQAMLEQQSLGGGGDEEILNRGLEALNMHMRELQESVMAIRMQAVKSVFSRMPRLVRELTRKLGKNVRLVTSGEDTEVDKTIIELLADPLVHMIRNSLDHGIESPEDRRRAGKPEEAEIHLSAAHRSGRIVIEVADDGRGINRALVLSKAVEKGLVDPGASLSDDEIDNLIFLPGFSTADAVTDVSGRGVGMDVVKRSIQELGGRISVDSTPGVGSRFILSLPLTLAVMDGMVLRVGDERYVLPLACIIESARPLPEDVRNLMGHAEVVSLRDQQVPLIHLHKLFKVSGAITDPCQGLVVFAETDSGTVIGLVVDDLDGQRQVVIKSLEENFEPVAGVSAATILGDGKVALILEVNSLNTMFKATGRTATSPARNNAIDAEVHA